jgi:hypothetical protein
MDLMTLAPAVLYLAKAGEKAAEEIARNVPEYEGFPGRRKSTAMLFLLMSDVMCRGSSSSIRTTRLTKNNTGGK